MRPLFNSQNTLPKFPITLAEQDAGPETPPRKTFMGRELPTADRPLRMSSEEYHAKFTKSGGGDSYLDYMLLGLYPPGPYDESPEGKENTNRINYVIEALARKGQLTALNELIQRCEPLSVLPVDLGSLPSEQLTKFLANVSTYHPELTALKISAHQSTQTPEEIDRKVSSLKDFISRSTHLKTFTVSFILKELSLKVINAIASANHLESLAWDSNTSLSDQACDKLKEIIRNSPQLRCIGLSNHNRSEESLLEFLLTLRACPQLEILTLDLWNCHSEETCTQLSELIGKSTQLKQLRFSDQGAPAKKGQMPVIQAIATGLSENRSLNSVSLMSVGSGVVDAGLLSPLIQAAKHHPCLKQLALDRKNSYQLPIMRALAELLEANRGIIDVGIKAADFSKYQKHLAAQREFIDVGGGMIKADSIPKENTKILAELDRIADLIEEKIARNKALASGDMARIFSNAFFPSPGATPGRNHIGDPGIVLTEHILELSPNLSSFQNTMIETALSADEIARLEQEKEKKKIESNQTTNDHSIELRHTTNEGTNPESRS
jgi:hypothetical protein